MICSVPTEKKPSFDIFHVFSDFICISSLYYLQCRSKMQKARICKFSTSNRKLTVVQNNQQIYPKLVSQKNFCDLSTLPSKLYQYFPSDTILIIPQNPKILQSAPLIPVLVFNRLNWWCSYNFLWFYNRVIYCKIFLKLIVDNKCVNVNVLLISCKIRFLFQINYHQ